MKYLEYDLVRLKSGKEGLIHGKVFTHFGAEYYIRLSCGHYIWKFWWNIEQLIERRRIETKYCNEC